MISSVRSSFESYLRRNSNNILFNVIKIAVVGLLIGLSIVVYKILCLLLPSFISLIIVAYLVHKLLYTVCRVGTFPGSTWLWKRSIENTFQRLFVFRMRKKMTLLRSLIEFILEERLWYNFHDTEGLEEIKQMFITTLNNFQKQVRHKTLNNKQREFMELFAEIEQLLNEIKIVNKVDNSSLSLWAFLGRRDEFVNKPKTILCFEDKNQGYQLLNKSSHLENKLHDIICKKPLRERIQRWLYEDSFGTLDQLREELDNRYKCKPVTLKVEKDVTLDCVLVYGHIYEQDSQDNLDARHFEKEQQISEGTIIYCCPNAGYYEYMYNENEWIELYLRHGFNVFLWNYRGYGRSTGAPEPNKFRKDAEFIVDFLRQDLKQKKIGVHGESLGGIAVTHIGRTKNIDFLCADRTFSGVSAVPDISFGSKIASMFRIITLWDDRIAKDYAESQCYKIITYDPKDEIIHLLSSLKYGVTSQVALQKLGITEQSTKTNFKESYSLFSPYRVINIIQKLIKVIRFEFWQKQTQETLENDKSLLTKSQTLALFWAFHRISELFISMSSLNALNPRKKTKSPNKNNNMGPKMSSNSQVGKPGQTGFDTSAENSLNKNTRMDTQNNKEPINDPRQMLDESVSFISDKILNQSIESGIGTNENELLKSTETKSYKDMFDFEAQSSSTIVELLVKVFAIFEDLEAGGMFINDIMSYKEQYRFKAFQHFIQSFEIWGSYYPIEEIEEDNAKDISYHLDFARHKLKNFIKRIDKTLYKQRQNSSQNTSKLLFFILDDLELISSIFPQLLSRLEANSRKSTAVTDITNSNLFNQDDIRLELSNTKENIRLKASRSNSSNEGSVDNYNVGYLVPLSCGHNGTPRPHELKHFEYLFRNAGLLG